MQVSVRKGADPELFLVEKETGKFISSVGLIGGSKDSPLPIGNDCFVQEDNVAVEFNIPPCKSSDEFVKSIQYNLDYIKKKVDTLGLSTNIIPSAEFEKDQLCTYEAQSFGCTPDYNAWLGGKRNPRPSSDNEALRSAGGHIHIELSKEDNILDVVKAMDWFVGCQMLKFDSDNKRRSLYGRAGAFRPKPYGVEYRTASNAWIQDEDKMRWVWDQTDKAVAFVRSGKKFTEGQESLIQECINNGNTELLQILETELEY